MKRWHRAPDFWFVGGLSSVGTMDELEVLLHGFAHPDCNEIWLLRLMSTPFDLFSSVSFALSCMILSVLFPGLYSCSNAGRGRSCAHFFADLRVDLPSREAQGAIFAMIS
jgi:hypothetical protein